MSLQYEGELQVLIVTMTYITTDQQILFYKRFKCLRYLEHLLSKISITFIQCKR
jgi:hypothetical protein